MNFPLPAQETFNGYLSHMRRGLPVPMEKTLFKAVCIVMTRSARCANIAEYEPIAAPLRIARIPVALLLVRRNAADSIDVILCISLADNEREIYQWDSPSLRSSYLADCRLSPLAATGQKCLSLTTAFDPKPSPVEAACPPDDNPQSVGSSAPRPLSQGVVPAVSAMTIHRHDRSLL